MKFLAQIQNQTSSSNDANWVVILFVLAIIGLLIGWMVSENKYQSAKSDFQYDPQNKEKRKRFLDAAKSRGQDRGALEVMSIIQDGDEAVRKQQNQKFNLTSELQKLGDLRDKGVLSEQEFQQAKSKLLK